MVFVFMWPSATELTASPTFPHHPHSLPSPACSWWLIPLGLVWQSCLALCSPGSPVLAVASSTCGIRRSSPKGSIISAKWWNLLPDGLLQIRGLLISLSEPETGSTDLVRIYFSQTSVLPTSPWKGLFSHTQARTSVSLMVPNQLSGFAISSFRQTYFPESYFVPVILPDPALLGKLVCLAQQEV